MAEVTGLRNNGLPYPVYGAPWGVVFPILDADGDLVTGAASLDSEVSKNGDTFTDCTNEATEIATSSGVYYLLLTATEMTADVVTVIVKTSTSGAKTTTLTLYPRKLVPLRTGTAAGGASGYITLDASAGAIDDLWNGCLCVAVLDSATEARIIDDYTGSNQQASVTPDWNTTPDSDDTFTIYLPEGRQIPTVNATHIGGTSQTGRDLGASVLLSPGTGTGQISLSSGAVTVGTNNDKTGYTASTVSDKTGYALADSTSDAVIADAVWNALTASYGSAGTYGEALEAAGAGADPWLTALPGSYGAGTAGYLIGTNLNAPVGTVDTVVDAIKAKTDNLPASPAATGDAMTLASGAVSATAVADGAIDAAAFAAGALDAVWSTATRTLTGTQTFNLTGNITGNLSGSVGSVTGAVGSVTGNVGGSVGSVTGAVGSIAANGIAAASFASDVDAEARGWLGMAADDLDTQLGGILDAIGDIASTGAALNAVAGSVTVTTGTETGTYTNTQIADTAYHQVTASGGVIDYYYEFDIGTEGAPVSVSIGGRLHEGSPPSGGDLVDIYAYNWGGAAWEHISPPGTGDFVGVSGSTSANDVVKTMALLGRHVGTGADDGKVRIRLEGASLEANTAMYVNFIHVLYANPLTVSEIADAVWNELSTGHTDAGKAGAQLWTKVDDILADTAVIGAAGAGLTAIPWNAAWDAEVESEVADGLAAYDPPTKAELDAAVANVSVDEIQASALADLFNTDSGTTYGAAVAGSVVKEITDNAGGSSLTEAGIADAVWDEARSGHTGAGTFGLYLDAQVSTVGGGTLTAADIADAVWDEATAGHTTAGSFGEQVKTDIDAILEDTAVIGAAGAGLTAVPWNASWDAEVESEVADALAVYDPPTKAEMDSAFSTTNGKIDTVDDYVDTEVAAIKTVTDKLDTALELDGAVYRLTTNALEQAPTGGSAPTAAEIADAVWDEASAGHTDAGKAGAQVWTAVDAILADTGTDGVAVAAGSKTGYALTSDYDAAKTAAQAGDAMTLTAGGVTEVADGVLDRDMSAGTDSGSDSVRTPRQALRFLRNKWSVAGTDLTVTKEDDTTPSWTAVVTKTAGADPVTGSDPAGP